MSITLTSDLELSLISFDGSDSTLTWQGLDKRTTKKARVVKGGGGIIRGKQLSEIFSSKGGDYSRKAINRGRAIIRSNTVVQRLHYVKFGSI